MADIQQVSDIGGRKMDKQQIALNLKQALTVITTVVNALQNVFDDDSKGVTFEEISEIENKLRSYLAKTASTQCEAFKYLINHPEVSQVVGYRGYFALGDAHAIVSYSGNGDNLLVKDYQDEVVLVEITDEHYQFQHWGFQFHYSLYPEVKPTIFTNIMSTT